MLQTTRSPLTSQGISRSVLKRRIEFNHPVTGEGLWLGSAQLSENLLQCPTISEHSWTSRNASHIAECKTVAASGWSFKAQRHFVLGGFFDNNIIIKCKLELNGSISGIIKLTNSLCYQNLLFRHLLLGLIKLVEIWSDSKSTLHKYFNFCLVSTERFENRDKLPALLILEALFLLYKAVICKQDQICRYYV